METKITEIADGIYRLSTFFTEVAPPAGFTFNQFLVKGDEPLLFHCGMRGIFPLVSGAVAKIVPAESVRWITFGHVESDECGGMNQWLAAAPQAQVAHGQIACMVSLHDLAVGIGDDRDHRRLRQHRVLRTPQLPHERLPVHRMGVPVQQDDVGLQLRLAVEARPGLVGIAEHADRVEAERAQDPGENAHHGQHALDRQHPDALQVFRPANAELRFPGTGQSHADAHPNRYGIRS